MDGKKIAIIGGASVALIAGGYFMYKAISSKFGGGGGLFKKDEEDAPSSEPTIIERVVEKIVPSSSGSSSTSDRPTKKADILKFQKWVINTKGDKTILGGGGSTGYGDDGAWGTKTQKAWDKYGAEYKGQSSSTSSSGGSWSSTDNTAQKELYDRLDDMNADVDYDGSRWEWDVTNEYPTVFFQVYKDGLLVLEKQKNIYGGRYAKNSGTWKKTATGWGFTFGGKTYNAPYSGDGLKNVLWQIMKDANYFSWSDGKFVALDGALSAVSTKKKKVDLLDSNM